MCSYYFFPKYHQYCMNIVWICTNIYSWISGSLNKQRVISIFFALTECNWFIFNTKKYRRVHFSRTCFPIKMFVKSRLFEKMDLFIERTSILPKFLTLPFGLEVMYRSSREKHGLIITCLGRTNVHNYSYLFFILTQKMSQWARTIRLNLERRNTAKFAPKICQYEDDMNFEEIVLRFIEHQ